jgi:hypothetical protein
MGWSFTVWSGRTLGRMAMWCIYPTNDYTDLSYTTDLLLCKLQDHWGKREQA